MQYPAPPEELSLTPGPGSRLLFASPASSSQLGLLACHWHPQSAPSFPLVEGAFLPAEEQQGGISRPPGASLRCIFGFCSPHIFSSR